MCPHADVAAYEQQGWLVVAISGTCTARLHPTDKRVSASPRRGVARAFRVWAIGRDLLPR